MVRQSNVVRDPDAAGGGVRRLGFANTADSTFLTKLGGYLGIIDAAPALCLATALIADATAPREVLPIM